MTKALIGFIMAVFCFLILSGVSADEIRLVNGDHISGTIIQKEGEAVTIKTAYAGEIKIQWNQVASVITSEPAVFKLTDETMIKGDALATDKGKIKIKSGTILETTSIDLASITAINPKKVTKEKVQLHGFINLSAAISDGNTNNKNYYADGEVVARTEDNRYTLGTSFSQTEDEGKRTEENYLGYMKYDHFLSSKWYMYANALFNKDEFKDLNLMTSLGVGNGYQFWESDKKNFSIEGGISFVNEDFVGVEDESYPAGRWALKYDRFLFNTPAQFFHNHELLFGLSDTNDLYMRAQTGIRFPLIKLLTATFQLDHDWDNTPAPGKVRTDTRYRFGIGYSW